MNIKEIVFYATKTTTFKIVISKDEGYDMPKTAKELVEMVNTMHSNPARSLPWNTDNTIDDSMVIDDYEIKENDSE